MISQGNNKGWRNPWFLAIIGLILVVLLVNGGLIWYSMQHRSSLVDHEYSTKNRKSDTETIKDIEAQNALAWKVMIKQPPAIVLNTPAPFEINVLDREGQPVSGAMEVLAYRAADATKDFVTPFKEITSGHYQGYIAFPLKGYWELRIRVKRGKDIFEAESDKFTVAETK